MIAIIVPVVCSIAIGSMLISLYAIGGKNKEGDPKLYYKAIRTHYWSWLIFLSLLAGFLVAIIVGLATTGHTEHPIFMGLGIVILIFNVMPNKRHPSILNYNKTKTFHTIMRDLIKKENDNDKPV